MKKAKSLTIVIKLGTSSIVHEKTHEPRLSTLSVIVETAVKLRRDGHRVVLVSSGAIGVALQMMDMETRPKNLPQVQALAALGQARLMSIWDRFFMHLKQPVAQILLTRNDIADRTQYLNAQNTMHELLNMGIIPIVNENDTLSVAEIKFGDNDTLSAITAAMLQADYLFLMTDVDCLYTTNPRNDPDAEPILVVADISKLEADVSSAGSALGTGGMGTKIVAAKLATAAGVTTVITRSSQPGNVADIVSYVEAVRGSTPQSALPPAPLHTRFLPSLVPIRDRSFWLLHGLAPHGTLYIDEGAHRALRNGAGLLPVGILAVEGNFAQQEAARIVVVPHVGNGTSTGSTSPHRSHRADSASHSPTNGHAVDPVADAVLATAHSRRVSRGSNGIGTLAGYESLDIDLGAPPPPGSVDELCTPPLHFPKSDCREVGRALVNYAATEVARIKGLHSHEISDMLGYADSEYVALRENVSLFEGKEREALDKASLKERERARANEIKKALPARIGDLGSFA